MIIFATNQIDFSDFAFANAWIIPLISFLFMCSNYLLHLFFLYQASVLYPFFFIPIFTNMSKLLENALVLK